MIKDHANNREIIVANSHSSVDRNEIVVYQNYLGPPLIHEILNEEEIEKIKKYEVRIKAYELEGATI